MYSLIPFISISFHSHVIPLSIMFLVKVMQSLSILTSRLKEIFRWMASRIKHFFLLFVLGNHYCVIDVALGTHLCTTCQYELAHRRAGLCLCG